MRIPIGDPRRAAEASLPELTAAFSRFVSGGRYILGSEHTAFEAELARFLGVEHCVGVASGTDALELALLGVGCERGDEVVVAANCGGYTSTAARKLGLRVRYADVDKATLGLSTETIEPVLTPATRAVVVTHLYGLVGPVDAIGELCRHRGISVVEDCAQAAGARSRGRRAGSLGDVATFSFYPTKNLAALGDGGAVTTHSDEFADRVRLLRQYGWSSKYEIALPGGRNSRLDEIQAAFLRLRLDRLDERNTRRRVIVQRYAAALLPDAGRFVASDGDDFVAQLAVFVAADRDRARAALEAVDIATDVHYPIADHRQPAWRGEYAGVQLPATEHAVEHVLTVPCFPELTDEEIEHVCEALREL